MMQRLAKTKFYVVGAILFSILATTMVVNSSGDNRANQWRIVGAVGMNTVSPTSSLQIVTPPLIPSNEGIQLGDNWTLIGSPSSQSMFVAPASGSRPAGGTPTASEVGLSGSLVEGWVLTDAVNRAGGLTSLQLPLAATYANSVVGPTELFVTQYNFSSRVDALNYFNKINYADNGSGNVVSALSNSFGNITEVSSNVSGESVMNIQWTSGSSVVNVSAWGGNQLNAKQAVNAIFPSFLTGPSATLDTSEIGVNQADSNVAIPIFSNFSDLPWNSL
jgi:hypothetical protein